MDIAGDGKGKEPEEMVEQNVVGAAGTSFAPPAMITEQMLFLEIGKRIKELRVDHLGMRSQEKFALPIDVSRGAVANWEVGKGITLANLVKVAKVYSVNLVWLSQGQGEPLDRGHPRDELARLIRESGLDDEEQRDLVEEFKAVLAVRIKRRRKPRKDRRD